MTAKSTTKIAKISTPRKLPAVRYYTVHVNVRDITVYIHVHVHVPGTLTAHVHVVAINLTSIFLTAAGPEV